MSMSRLALKLRGLNLDGGILEAVLAELEHEFGLVVALALSGEQWLLDWERWAVFVGEVRAEAQTWSAGFLVIHARHVIKEFFFALRRVVLSQQAGWQEHTRSDAEALGSLQAAGFRHVVGQVWGRNQCLADSLLQTLIAHELVAGEVDRRKACQENRAHLEAHEALVPRDIHGNVDLGGYLQHHRHAAATLKFFLEHFGCQGSGMETLVWTLKIKYTPSKVRGG